MALGAVDSVHPRAMRPVRVAVGVPTHQHHAAFADIEVEAAINGGAIAPGEVERVFLLIMPLVEQRVAYPARQQARRGGGTEDHAAAGAARARDLLPQRIELGVGHPVLRVEQHIAIEAARLMLFQIIDEIAVADARPVEMTDQRLMMARLQIEGEGGVRRAGIAAPNACCAK